MAALGRFTMAKTEEVGGSRAPVSSVPEEQSVIESPPGNGWRRELDQGDAYGHSTNRQEIMRSSPKKGSGGGTVGLCV